MTLINMSKTNLRKVLSKRRITISVIGLGRVGLPTAAVLADAGAIVVGVDIDRNVVKRVNAGQCQFMDEPGLGPLIERMVSSKRLRATSDAGEAVEQSEVIILCVPTPVSESKVPDYSAVRAACTSLAKNLRKGTLIIVESTVGPGTVENLVIPLIEREAKMKAGLDFGIASCPERGDPGRMLENLKSVPRIVGGINSTSTQAASALYEITLGAKVIKVSDPKTANAAKLTENLFRDVNIALANELAILYEKLKIDTIEVIDACASKYNFMPHYPGAGVGGPCIPQNPYYLIVESIKVGNIPYLVRMAREINDRMPEHVVTLVTDALNEVGKTVKGSRIALLGVAYKPSVHDLQLTPVKKVFQQLKMMGGQLTLYDPLFKGETVFGTHVSKTLTEAVQGVDCIVVGTAHQEFYHMDYTQLSHECNKPAAFVDTRHVASPSIAKKHGFAFRGIGRPSRTHT